jgi:hypothetical protein
MSNSDFVWARGEVLIKMGFKFIFPVFFEELLQAAMWLKLPKGWRQGAKKKVCFAHRILDFHSFALFFCSWFQMMSLSMWLLWFKCEVFDFFSRNYTRSTMLKFWVKIPSTKRILSHFLLQIWSWDLSHVCATWI